MKKMAISLIASLIGFVLIISIPAFGQGMMDAGPGADTDSRGPGPMMDQGSRNGHLEKGFNYRYGMETPSASVENEKGTSGIMISLGSIEQRTGDGAYRIDIKNAVWEISEDDLDPGNRITYESEMQWKGTDDEIKGTSGVILVFQYKWGDGERTLDLDLEITDPPGEGEISIELDVPSSGLGNDCCWKDGQQNMQGHGFRYQNGEGEELGEILIDENAETNGDDGEETVATEVNISSIEEVNTLRISSSISENIDTYSVGGSLMILDEFLKTLGDAGEEAVSYILDHIVSFAIGISFIMFVLVLSVVYMSKKRVDTSGEELSVVNNRYYRKG